MKSMFLVGTFRIIWNVSDISIEEKKVVLLVLDSCSVVVRLPVCFDLIWDLLCYFKVLFLLLYLYVEMRICR